MRPLDGHPREAEFDPDAERRRRFQRRVWSFLLYSLFVTGLVASLVGRGGWVDAQRLRGELQGLQGERDERAQSVLELRREIDGLEDGGTGKERIARERLGMVAPGEITFLLPVPDDWRDPPPPSVAPDPPDEPLP